MTAWKRKSISYKQIPAMTMFQQAERGESSWADAAYACWLVGMTDEAKYADNMARLLDRRPRPGLRKETMNILAVILVALLLLSAALGLSTIVGRSGRIRPPRYAPGQKRK